MLTRLRRESAREDYENRNCNRFRRIFPPEDKFRREKYASLLNESFKTFLAGRSSSLQKEIEEQYSQKYRVSVHLLLYRSNVCVYTRDVMCVRLLGGRHLGYVGGV